MKNANKLIIILIAIFIIAIILTFAMYTIGSILTLSNLDTLYNKEYYSGTELVKVGLYHSLLLTLAIVVIKLVHEIINEKL